MGGAVKHQAPDRAAANAPAGNLVVTLAALLLTAALLPSQLHATGHPVSCLDIRRGETFDLRAERVLLSGAVDTTWVPDSSRLCVGNADGVSSGAIAMSDSGTLVAWVDGRSGDGDIYAQRVTSTGELAEGLTVVGLGVQFGGRGQGTSRMSQERGRRPMVAHVSVGDGYWLSRTRHTSSGTCWRGLDSPAGSAAECGYRSGHERCPFVGHQGPGGWLVWSADSQVSPGTSVAPSLQASVGADHSCTPRRFASFLQTTSPPNTPCQLSV